MAAAGDRGAAPIERAGRLLSSLPWRAQLDMLGGRRGRRDRSRWLFGAAALASAALLLWAARRSGLRRRLPRRAGRRRRPALPASAGRAGGRRGGRPSRAPTISRCSARRSTARRPTLALALTDGDGAWSAPTRPGPTGSAPPRRAAGLLGDPAVAASPRRDRAATMPPLDARRPPGRRAAIDAGRRRRRPSALAARPRRRATISPREAKRLIAGEAGRRHGRGRADGRARRRRRADPRRQSAPSPLRAAGPRATAPVEGTPLVDHLAATDERPVPLRAEGKAGAAAAHRPGPGRRRRRRALASSCCSTTCPGARGEDENAHVHALLDSLPLGLALADARRPLPLPQQGVPQGRRPRAHSERPAWPGDLVVDEDKAAVSDAVRRFGRGRPMSGDLAVRLKTKPDEPVALTVAGARGLGDAAVLLSHQGQ